ncbi:MAG: AAA family ATPase [Euryarchaeota archaeon]|nr:AAA family ATPase [Euryarchaeota archaeon]
MAKDSELRLTVANKILLHLRDYWLCRDRLEFPLFITQKGISEATGVQLTHVPRALKQLRAEGLIKELTGHVEGERRRYKVYFLTEEGMQVAHNLRAGLMERTVSVAGPQGSRDAKIGALLEEMGTRTSLVRLLASLEGKEHISIPRAQKQPERRHSLSSAPSLVKLVDREEELRHLRAALESRKCRLVVVLGGPGIGKTAIVRAFAEEECPKRSVAWLDLRSAPGLKHVLDGLQSHFGGDRAECGGSEESGRAAARRLESGSDLVVLDGYSEVPEETVEFFISLIGAMGEAEKGVMLVMTMREDTPSYNRFYGRREVESGIVEELHVRGLAMEDCAALLGTTAIDPDALRRIYLMTKGNPQTLLLIAAGDIERLKQTTRMTTEEIRLLLFLKNVKLGKG